MQHCCSASGLSLEFKIRGGYQEAWIVSDTDFEVLQEVVLWPSLEALAAAGVDVSTVQ